MSYEIPVTQARAELADLINRVVYGGERVVVTRHGKPLIALVSAADLERLEKEREVEEEQVISSVSAIRSMPSAPGERRRFGIAAEHRPEHRPEHRQEHRTPEGRGPETGERPPGHGR
ncbi:type II toxin-antitoxin system Phd/YefM family antitoxin [Streptomyces sp. NPDC058405]|uniref:type II toxin-antitoxin system Phd/YefM family antitoxin n=1 Tax=Streptomyces sp. NPDC058405 TaxID=3346482 RepID=UPI00365CC5FE